MFSSLNNPIIKQFFSYMLYSHSVVIWFIAVPLWADVLEVIIKLGFWNPRVFLMSNNQRSTFVLDKGICKEKFCSSFLIAVKEKKMIFRRIADIQEHPDIAKRNVMGQKKKKNLTGFFIQTPMLAKLWFTLTVWLSDSLLDLHVAIPSFSHILAII